MLEIVASSDQNLLGLTVRWSLSEGQEEEPRQQHSQAFNSHTLRKCQGMNNLAGVGRRQEVRAKRLAIIHSSRSQQWHVIDPLKLGLIKRAKKYGFWRHSSH
jgi:hypothetical protein